MLYNVGVVLSTLKVWEDAKNEKGSSICFQHVWKHGT